MFTVYNIRAEIVFLLLVQGRWLKVRDTCPHLHREFPFSYLLFAKVRWTAAAM